MAKMKPRTELPHETDQRATESATTESGALDQRDDTITLKRGPFTLTAAKVEEKEGETSHYEIDINKDGTTAKPGELAPELEHLDVHFEVGANSSLAKKLCDKLFDWFLKAGPASVQ